MTRAGVVAAAALVLLAGAPLCLAKNDIRGVATAQPLRDVLETLELDGAQCGPSAESFETVCSYDYRTRMTVYAAASPPNKVEKLVYTFSFKDLAKMRAKLQLLYGLRYDHIEGEHRLFTGERLDVELRPDGAGSLTITNEALIRAKGPPARR